MPNHYSRFAFVAAPLALVVGALAAPSQEEVLEGRMFHLGNDATPEWPEAAAEPDADNRLEIRFSARRNRKERTLAIKHRHVDDPWRIVLNGAVIGTLERKEALRSFYYPVPEGALRDGENVLEIVTDRVSDDITVGEVRLLRESYRELMRIEDVRVVVRGNASRRPLPARITVRDESGKPARIYYAERPMTAVREGVLYTGNGEALLGLVAGRYTLYASRGLEWSVATADVEASAGTTPEVRLELVREVDTSGWIAADTHVHTFTYSGHGDASIEERMLTFAGEGVELAISTDHNHQTDYRPVQQAMGMQPWFTPVVGNEVTTPIGHFNAFPLPAGGPIPDHALTDWVRLVQDIRAMGARFVILNHPRWPADGKGPYSVEGLNPVSGERHSGARFLFDAFEIFNSTTEEGLPQQLFDDWWALLNHGEELTAVGSSDSHTVAAPVGMGRTYLPSSTDDAAALDVDALLDAFQAGRFSASLGAFVTAELDGAPMGALVRAPRGRPMRLVVTVRAPSWAPMESVQVFQNGERILERPLAAREGMPLDARVEFALEAPAADAWLAVVVRGPVLDLPWWPSPVRASGAVANPIRIDSDGDGAWSSPRQQARVLMEQAGSAPDAVRAAIAAATPAVAVQLASLAREAWTAELRERLVALGVGESATAAAVQAFVAQLPPQGPTPR
ncbi:MAG TPA: CehA/McbA family metallohydrolase [Planctomycetota bacterium]